jgi:hypothetical protein
MADPIAPPNSFQSDPVAHVDVTGVPPQPDQAPQTEQSFVPKEVLDAAATLSGKGTPDQNVATGKAIEKAAKDAPYLHMNEQMQLPGMIFSALKGDLAGVWKYYNGGPVQYETARGADGKFYQKGYNANGFNGEYKTVDGQHTLDQDEINALNDRGGALSGRDAAILKSARYDNFDMVNKAYQAGSITSGHTAFANAIAAASLANDKFNLSQQGINEIKLIRSGVLNTIANLSPEKRALLVQGVNAFNTANTSKGNTGNFDVTANAGKNDTNSKSVGGSVAGSLGAVIPPGPAGAPGAPKGPELSVSGNENRTAQTNTGVHVGQAGGSTNSTQTGSQIQSTIASNIAAQLQGAMSPEDFMHFARLQGIMGQVNNLAAKEPTEAYAPGHQSVEVLDPSIAGENNLIKNLVQHQQNASLSAAYADSVNRAWQQMGKTGEIKNARDMYNDFANSDQFKGILNSYKEKEENDNSVGHVWDKLTPEQQAQAKAARRVKGAKYVDIKTNQLQ